MIGWIACCLGNEDQMLPVHGATQEQRRLLPSKRLLLEASVEELQAWMVSQRHPEYRARQVFEWVIQRRAERFEPMSDLSLVLRKQLALEWSIFSTHVAFQD